MKIEKIIQKIKKNWKVKVLCLLVSIVIYIICQIAFLESKSFAVPLRVKNASNLIYVNDIPRFVRVTVRGEPSEIALLQQKDFDVFIDLSESVEPGEYKIPLHLQLSENATIIEKLEVVMNPDLINLKLEQKVTALIPIKVNIAGVCAKGYEISSFEVYPDLVQVSGSEALVSKTAFLETTPVNVSGKSSDFNQLVEVVNQNNRISITGEKEFNVSVKISPIKSSKIIENSTIFYYGLKEGLNVENSNIPYILSISGTKNDLDKFTLSPLSVQVDCSSIEKSGTYELPLSVILPENIKLDKIEPSIVKINVIDLPELSVQDGIGTEIESENSIEKKEESKTDDNSSLPSTE